MPTIVDLSQEIYQGMPVYPGHLNTVIFDYHTHENTQGVMESDLTYATHGIILSDHGPTHVDSPTPDNPASRIYPVHLICRREGLHHYENLANLGAVAGKRFTFFGLPLRFRGGQGSPVRAVALLDE